jgi:hypothetical protein
MSRRFLNRGVLVTGAGSGIVRRRCSLRAKAAVSRLSIRMKPTRMPRANSSARRAAKLLPSARPSSDTFSTTGRGLTKKRRINPVQSKLPMHLSRRCRARTRTGSACPAPAMPNGRCRMHGGMSPGAPKGNRNAWKHGHYSAEAVASRKILRVLLLHARKALECS